MLDVLYDRISEIVDIIADIEVRINGAYGEKITANQLYEILLNFDKMYFKMTDLEKKQLCLDFRCFMKVLRAIFEKRVRVGDHIEI